ncbi:MAG: hypothetical protein SO183_01330 [Fusobacterium mortiferum]|jgi:hypothetical protein|nr:hypothetical protein [Fusobacterium mortiferum]MDY4800281.1 hypothetical protein [Fusobacterium mortiferum]MDY5980006.1 hypothetical protein [Fusobacterium mortiferum]
MIEKDTIIVPCKPEGVEIFLKRGYWEKITIAEDKIKDLKYIALYQSISEKKITRIGKIIKIDKYIVSEYKPLKCRVYFKLLDKILDIVLDDTKNRRLIIQSPRYTNSKKLFSCKTFSELFSDNQKE